ncbi:hypothetical protein DUHN55_26070 [Helicobacter pylori]
MKQAVRRAIVARYWRIRPACSSWSEIGAVVTEGTGVCGTPSGYVACLGAIGGRSVSGYPGVVL